MVKLVVLARSSLQINHSEIAKFKHDGDKLYYNENTVKTVT